MHSDMFVKAFNQELRCFLITVHQMLPDEKELATAKIMVESIMAFSPKYICQKFRECMSPFRDEIARRDDSLITSDAFGQQNAAFAAYGIASDVNPLQLMKIQDHWNSFQPREREMIWEYTENLLSLADRAHDE